MSSAQLLCEFLLEIRNVKAEGYYEWHRAHIAAKLGIGDPDSGIFSLKLVDEETEGIAAYCQWGFSSQVCIIQLI